MTSSASQQYHGDKNVLSHLPFSSNVARYGVFGIYNHSQFMKRVIYIMFLLAQIVYLYLVLNLDQYVLLKLGSISSSN